MKTAVQGEDVLCRLREPKDGQDQLLIKTRGMYWELGSPSPSDVCKDRIVCGRLLSITIWSCLRVGQLSASSVSCLPIIGLGMESFDRK